MYKNQPNTGQNQEVQPQEGQAAAAAPQAAEQVQQNPAELGRYRVITSNMLKVPGLSFRRGGGGPAPTKFVKSWSELEQPKVTTPQAAAPQQEQQNPASEATDVAASEIPSRFRWPMAKIPYRNSLHYKGPPPIWDYDSDSSQSSEEKDAGKRLTPEGPSEESHAKRVKETVDTGWIAGK